MITPVAYWSLLALLTLIYRLSSFHPLAKYPGPFLHRISKLRIVHTYSQGGLHKHFQKLHQQYGDVVRVGECDVWHLPCSQLTFVLRSERAIILQYGWCTGYSR